MRLHIRHETAYRYATPATRAIQVLRLTPRGHDGQFVVHWRIDVDRDCRLEPNTDPFGDRVHTITVDGPLDALTIVAEGVIETQDTDGVIAGQVERVPVPVFLRATRLTEPDAAIRDFADAIARKAPSDRIGLLHALMTGVRERLRFNVDATDAGTSARQAFAAGHGVCQDFAHVFIAAARHLDIPTRYVGGYLFPNDLDDRQEAGHAWAEALIEDLGWVGFDPANGTSPTEAYVRVGIGLDYLGAAPVRGAQYGGSGEKLSVRVLVERSDHTG